MVQDTTDSKLSDSTAGDEVRPFRTHFKYSIELSVMGEVDVLDDTNRVDQLICGSPTTIGQRCP
jgi:hypothetical protein